MAGANEALRGKLQPLLQRRAELASGHGEVDWATAEQLAWGTLLLEGVPVRLSGQDSGRGTFSQRHAVLYDTRSGREHVPLNTLAPAGVRFEVHDSLLSEAAVMGYEFDIRNCDGCDMFKPRKPPAQPPY